LLFSWRYNTEGIQNPEKDDTESGNRLIELFDLSLVLQTMKDYEDDLKKRAEEIRKLASNLIEVQSHASLVDGMSHTSVDPDKKAELEEKRKQLKELEKKGPETVKIATSEYNTLGVAHGNGQQITHQQILLANGDKAISHDGPITSILVSPNGKYLLTASLDCTVKRCPITEAEKQSNGDSDDEDDETGWVSEKELKVQTFEAFRSLQTHDSGVLCIAISPSSNHVVTAGADGVAHHWIMQADFFDDVHPDWMKKEGFLVTDAVHFACLKHDSSDSGKDFGIRKVISNNKSTGKPFFVTASDDHIIRRFDITVKKSHKFDMKKKYEPGDVEPSIEFQGHTASIDALGLTDDDLWLISGGLDEMMCIWNADTLTKVRSVDTTQSPCSIISPRFTLKFSSAIRSLQIDSTNEGVLLVGLASQSRVQGDEAFKETLVAVPQLHVLLYDNVIPSSFLELMSRVDENRHDPQEKYRNVRRALKEGSPMATSLTSQAFFLQLAEEANTIGLKRCLFDFDDRIYCTTIPFSHLLEAARHGHSKRNYVERVTDWIRVQLANEVQTPTWSRDYAATFRSIFVNARSSVQNHNDVLANKAKPRFMHAGYTRDRGHFCMQLTGPTGSVKEALTLHTNKPVPGLLENYPDQVLSFLSKVPNMRSDASVNHPKFQLTTTMKRNSMLVCGAPEVVSTDLWYEQRVVQLVALHSTFGWFWRSKIWRGFKYIVWFVPNIFYGVGQSSTALVTSNDTLWGRLETVKNSMKDSLEIDKLKGVLAQNRHAVVQELGENFRRRGTESCVLPWPHFLTGSILMRKLLDTNDTDFFAPTLVVALVQQKWETFGRPRFTQDLFVN
jgi:WD40 repeat protein